jgi:LacI family transcriptional regulator
MKEFVSLRNIADKLGVSVSTVSLALRNSPKISVKRRLEIRRTATEMGYKQDPRVSELMEHLRQTRHTRTHSRVAVLVPDLVVADLGNYPPVPALIRGVKEMAKSVGFGVDVIYLTGPGMNSRLARKIILARGIKGVVVAPFSNGVAELNFDFEGLCVATAGYSIVKPALHRACPDYLKMMDEMLSMCVSAGCQRIGLVMTYKEGGNGFKLFTSSFLYFQSKLPESARLPILESPRRDPAHEDKIDPVKLSKWLKKNKPDVVIGGASALRTVQSIGLKVPEDFSFVSMDVSESPHDAAGANHCYDMVGHESFKLLHSSLNLNVTGVPEHPRVVMVDSHQQSGFTLVKR